MVLTFYPLESNSFYLSLEAPLEIAYNLTVSDIETHADALLEFHAGFADFFRSATRSVAPMRGITCRGNCCVNRVAT